MSQARSHPDTLRIPKYARVAPGALMYTAQTRCLVTEAVVRVVHQENVLEVVEQEMVHYTFPPIVRLRAPPGDRNEGRTERRCPLGCTKE